MSKLSFYTILVLTTFFTTLNAQSWELGVFGGGTGYLGDLTNKSTPYLDETNLAAGLNLSYIINKQFTVGVQGTYAQISGDDANLGASFLARNFNFNSDLIEVTSKVKWEPLGKNRYDENGIFQAIISPYIWGGVGYTLIDAQPDFSATEFQNGQMKKIEEDQANQTSGALVIPVGAGVRFDITRSFALDAEFGMRKSQTDYLDGISVSANPDASDWYMVASLGATFRLGNKDKDKDGIIDEQDVCPTVPGVLSAKGCPDADGDGLEDAEDICPFEAGRPELNGCPDTDGDGVADKDDLCVGEQGTVETQGCPDADADGVADKDDLCPNDMGKITMNGCPDTDNDGVADNEDKCPEVVGIGALAGCPDSDGDGVADNEDKCPDVAAVNGLNGCPDRDNDKIIDSEDKCPDLAGNQANKGCPGLSDEEKALIAHAIQNIEFESGSAQLKTSSDTILTSIADICKKYPHYDIEIVGHTDNVGNAVSNQKLSEQRAKSCYDFLAEKGVEKTRMTFVGKGETEPIADNNTKKGRQKNRRVDFDLKME